MNATEMKMVGLLEDLKENHHAFGVKGNMESSGMDAWETIRLKEVTLRAGLPLTIKLGGAEALTDMRHARALGADRIAAPMTSCQFSLRKFIAGIDRVFPPEDKKGVQFVFYIETINAYSNIDSMLQAPNIEVLGGLVIGREDLVWSMGLAGSDADYNDSRVLEITKDILRKAKAKGLETTVGGGITSAGNLKNLKEIEPGLLNAIQTKMVRFHCPAVFNQGNAGLLKATEFELLWLKNKSNYHEATSREDLKGIRTLEARYSVLQ
jgi:4-hydroxy-2-oxoheptanedioate aldolase